MARFIGAYHGARLAITAGRASGPHGLQLFLDLGIDALCHIATFPIRFEHGVIAPDHGRAAIAGGHDHGWKFGRGIGPRLELGGSGLRRLRLVAGAEHRQKEKDKSGAQKGHVFGRFCSCERI